MVGRDGVSLGIFLPQQLQPLVFEACKVLEAVTPLFFESIPCMISGIDDLHVHVV